MHRSSRRELSKKEQTSEESQKPSSLHSNCSLSSFGQLSPGTSMHLPKLSNWPSHNFSVMQYVLEVDGVGDFGPSQVSSSAIIADLLQFVVQIHPSLSRHGSSQSSSCVLFV